MRQEQRQELSAAVVLDQPLVLSNDLCSVILILLVRARPIFSSLPFFL